jgi:hypothetical protein
VNERLIAMDDMGAMTLTLAFQLISFMIEEEKLQIRR